MKKPKFEVWINGHYFDTFKTRELAETFIRIEQRQDRYEREVLSYTNKLPTYEIKEG